MRRSPRVLVGSALVAVVFGSGGWLSLLHHSASRAWPGAPEIRSGSLLSAVQGPAPGHVAPSTSAKPPKSPQPSASAQPSKSTKPSTKPSTSAKPSSTAPAASATTVNQLLAQINKLRADNGLPPYTILAGLNASAHRHNLVMMGTCGMSHQCPDEPSLGSRISAQGVHWTACGENIGWSGPHPNTTSALVGAAEGLTTAMYNEKPPDDGHRLNLLSTQFRHVGIDVVRDSSGRVWLTQDFSN